MGVGVIVFNTIFNTIFLLQQFWYIKSNGAETDNELMWHVHKYALVPYIINVWNQIWWNLVEWQCLNFLLLYYYAIEIHLPISKKSILLLIIFIFMQLFKWNVRILAILSKSRKILTLSRQRLHTVLTEFDWLIFWCLMPLSAIFQLYHGDQF